MLGRVLWGLQVSPVCQIRLAVCEHGTEEATIVAEATFAVGTDVFVGSADASVIIPGWVASPVLLISGDGFLHLGPGMRVNMCHAQGADRIVGTYEELVESGVVMPIPILRRRMNIRVQAGISIFAKYIDADVS